MLELEYFMWLEHAVTYDPGLGNGRAGVGSGFHRWHSFGAIGCPSMPYLLHYEDPYYILTYPNSDPLCH